MAEIHIDTTKTRQSIDGWGTSLCWWANAAGGWDMPGESGGEKREELMRLFFTPEGLDMNIVRYNLGGGDNPEEEQHMFHFRGIPCYRQTPDGEFNPEADARQLWVLKRAQELQGERLVTEVFVNSPPWWMTKSLCSAGNVKGGDENLDAARYGEFAAYCAEALEWLERDFGVKVQYFDPMNEPASEYWAKGQRQEGNRVAPGESQSALLAAAHRALAKRGLATSITGTDETNPTVAVESFNALDEEVKQNVLAKINYHLYTPDDAALKQLCRIAYPKGFEAPRYKLWMDEICYGDGGEGMELAKKLVVAIAGDLNLAHASGWVIWQAMDTMSENIRDNCHWGLVEGMYQDKNNNELGDSLDVSKMGYEYGDYVITDQYYVLGHYSRYIKPGFRVVENDGAEDWCVSALGPDGKTLAVVLYNDGEADKRVTLRPVGFAPRGGTRVVTNERVKWETITLEGDISQVLLPAKSIVTIEYTA